MQKWKKQPLSLHADKGKLNSPYPFSKPLHLLNRTNHSQKRQDFVFLFCYSGIITETENEIITGGQHENQNASMENYYDDWL